MVCFTILQIHWTYMLFQHISLMHSTYVLLSRESRGVIMGSFETR